MTELYHGDCLNVMKDLPEESIDLILCDLPYQNLYERKRSRNGQLYGVGKFRRGLQEYRQTVYRNRSRRLLFSIGKRADRKRLRRVAVAE